MGLQEVEGIETRDERERLLGRIQKELDLLDGLLSGGKLAEGAMIGAEQELCLIDDHGFPSPNALKVLNKLESDHFTTELAQHNLEVNLEPARLEGNVFSQLYTALTDHLERIRNAAQTTGDRIIMTGILPTIRRHYISREHMTPKPRYDAMLRSVDALRDEDYTVRIEGAETLVATDRSTMFQSANTSFQVHYQVDPTQIADQYNFAQLIGAPVLAAATNAPFFLEKRLWHETRIALFQQAVDTRDATYHNSHNKLRVPFGERWMGDDPLEVFREDLARYHMFLKPEEYAAIPEPESGEVPKLTALQVFNGTVFRWNRLCYGIREEIPHLRIENRLLPAGPTVKDELANAAFWTGLMHGLPERYRDLSQKVPFKEVRINTMKAAKYGLDATLSWPDGEQWNADALIREELIPLASAGLERAGVSERDRTEYLQIIQERVTSQQTGSRWMIAQMEQLSERTTTPIAQMLLTEAIHKRQHEGLPVHQWGDINEEDVMITEPERLTAEKIMSTQLFTVSGSKGVEEAAYAILQSGYRSVPVVTDDWRLVGLIENEMLARQYQQPMEADSAKRTMAEIANENPDTISLETDLPEMFRQMLQTDQHCLPVVDQNTLIGLITAHDLMSATESLITT